MEKSSVIGITLLFGLLGTKQETVVLTMKQQKNEEVSAVSLYGTVCIKFLKNVLLRVLVVLQVGGTPVATPHLIRFVICCVDGHERL